MNPQFEAKGYTKLASMYTREDMLKNDSMVGMEEIVTEVEDCYWSQGSNFEKANVP